MSAIFKREFKAFFQTVIGWIFIAANLFVLGVYFTVYNMMQAYPYIAYTLSGVMFLFIICMPVLSMRILAEERKAKTDQLLFTSPISIGKIVIGKYLAMVCVFAVTVVVACVYPIVMSFFGTIAMGEAYTAILAYFLYGLACLAIGMFISSVTESQVIAAVISFAILFIGYMMSGLESLISSSGNLFTKFLSWFDLRTPCTDMMSGVFDVTSVVYYITVIALFIFLTCQSIQKRRWSMTKINAKTGAFSSAFVLIAIIVCVVVNLAVSALPEGITSLDVTSQKLYSLTDDTEEMLADLDQDITIYVLVDEASEDSTVAKTLDRYAAASDHITIEYKDQTTYPTFYSSYTSTAPTDNSLIVVCGDRSKVIDYDNLYETEYSMDSTTYQYTSTTTGYDAEGQITSAISYVTSDSTASVYVLEGQDEPDLGSDFTDVIEKKNLSVETINLLQYDAVPDDCQCLIINAPQSDFSDEDTAKIINYLQNGGDALIIAGYAEADMPNFESILSVYGIGTTGGIVCETQSSNYTQQTPYYLVESPETTDLTSGVTGEYLFLPYATGLTVSDDTDTLTTQTLVSSSDSSVVKTNPNGMTSYSYEDGDIEGPVVLGAWATLTVDGSASGDATASADASGDADDTLTSEVVVMSSYYFLDDTANETVSGNNLTLFQSVMDELVQEATGVSIPVKSYEVEYLTITTMSTIIISVMAAVVIPVVLIIVGIVIWVRRRKR